MSKQVTNQSVISVALTEQESARVSAAGHIGSQSRDILIPPKRANPRTARETSVYVCQDFDTEMKTAAD